jgi:hypothetical protein
METPIVEKAPPKTEAELIATVANIQDAERSLLFAQRATKAGMPALAAACEERAKALTPIKPPRAKRKPAPIKAAKVNPREQTRRSPFAPTSRSKPTEPSGSVEAITSKAAEVIQMRIMARTQGSL